MEFRISEYVLDINEYLDFKLEHKLGVFEVGRSIYSKTNILADTFAKSLSHGLYTYWDCIIQVFQNHTLMDHGI